MESNLKEDIHRIEEDVKEIKKDLKTLLMFMAVEQAKAKHNVILFSGIVSLCVSVASLFIGKVL